MAQYIISATSASKNLTESNTVRPRTANPDEETRTEIPFPGLAEFETLELAQANAAAYARFLNRNEIHDTHDWVGHAALD